jgi:hypothetical protein
MLACEQGVRTQRREGQEGLANGSPGHSTPPPPLAFLEASLSPNLGANLKELFDSSYILNHGS